MTQLVTGEAVALDLRPAALPSRLVAAAIDAVAQGLILLILFLLLTAATPGSSTSAISAAGIVIVAGVLAGYPIAFEALWRGRTPGKAAMGLRVVRDDGGPIGFRQALFRGLAGLFLEKPGLTLFAGAVITSLLNTDSKRLGDLGAGTIVLQERIPTRVFAPAVMPPPLAGWAGTLDLSGLADNLALSVRSFLARAPDLTPQAREQLGDSLVRAVAAVVTPAAPPGTPGWAYLSAVLAERRGRAEHRLAPAAHGTVPAVPGTVPAVPGDDAQRVAETPGPQADLPSNGFIAPG